MRTDNSHNKPGADAAAAERRDLRRRPVLLAGVIAYGQGVYAVDCTIRDLSVRGARVSVSKPQPLPVGVWLLNIRERIAHDARVVWRTDHEFGLAFVRTLTLGEASDPSLAFLKRLWLGRAAR